ncbi:hypothetical protein [Lysinibacillus sp. BPa_S21]|uniref:hypothetical protein n=1 Tax=Lysinibacillus sp. BPa_S21 TaxID=2932478 RepID=UPI0020122A9F|nr:hypothetical protein [Lysinibacillus sp. BPa_S21]MCL1696300.1 hypothetical protein [Lysinibacillus sp. BPa_S21]
MTKDESIVRTKNVNTDEDIMSDELLSYKSDHSVITLKTEMKDLGRALRDKKDELNKQEIEAINKGISDIKETLKLLKVKHGVI